MENRRYLTIDLATTDMAHLAARSLNMSKAERIAGILEISFTCELEDLTRYRTLFVPTEKLRALFAALGQEGVSYGTLDVYDPVAIPIAQELNVAFEEMHDLTQAGSLSCCTKCVTVGLT